MKSFQLIRLFFFALLTFVNWVDSVQAASLGPERQVAIHYNIAGLPEPRWTNGALVLIEGENTAAPSFTLLDKSGQYTSSMFLTIPGASLVTVSDVAHGPNATVAAVGDAFASNGSGAPYLAVLGTQGRSAVIVRTSPYHPDKVAIAPDGSLWTTGIENDQQDHKPSKDPKASVLRHFDESGHMLGAFLPQQGVDKLIKLVSDGLIACSNEKVAWYLDGRYVEMSPDGKTQEFSGLALPTGYTATGLALTSLGDTILSTNNSQLHHFNVFVLDRSAMAWRRVDQHQQIVHMYGIEGDQVVGRTTSFTSLSFITFQK